MANMMAVENLKIALAVRYGYYRRCQVFRQNGEQCKAPAQKGEEICHAHAGQQAMALWRERQKQAVLAEAVEEMRRRGRTEFEAKDLLMDFNGIQITIAKMAQALIEGRIDTKTAGRFAVNLQMMMKILAAYHRGTQRHKTLPLINTDNTDSKRMINAKSHECVTDSLKHQAQPGERRDALRRLAAPLTVDAKVVMFPTNRQVHPGGEYWTGQQTRAA